MKGHFHILGHKNPDVDFKVNFISVSNLTFAQIFMPFVHFYRILADSEKLHPNFELFCPESGYEPI